MSYVYRLCKEYGNKLSGDERKVVIMGITDMRLKDADSMNSYIRGLFHLALKALDK